MIDDQRIAAWFSEREATPKSVREGVARVMAEVSQTRQQGRVLPLPIHRPTARTPTIGDHRRVPVQPHPGHQRPYTHRHREDPVHAQSSQGHRRRRPRLRHRRGDAHRPACRATKRKWARAEVGAAAPTQVTGTIEPVDGTCSQLDSSADGDVSRNGYECTSAWTSSDPRLTGNASRRWNEDTYRTDEDTLSVGTDSAYLQDEDGGWACSAHYLVKGSTPTEEPLTDLTFTCVGSGGYAGLSAVLVSVRPDPEDFSEEFVGLIFSGDVPPMPEPPAAE